MALVEFFARYPAVYLGYALVIGLVVGSFLNVVIHRIPLMLQRAWRQDCQEYLRLPADAPPEPFNLATPASHCPQCKQPIRAWQNIPILSYLYLGGRCGFCRNPIPLRYPLVELLTGVMTLGVAWHFGPTGAMLAAALLTWALIALSFIDLDHQLLPDNLTLPTLWLGLLLSLWGVLVPPSASILGAVGGYLSLWSIYQLFRLATGKQGMGYGDFKLLALLGAWLGWQALLPIIIIASLSGAVIGTLFLWLRGLGREAPIPFGPFLAVAGWLTLMWGEPLQRWFLPI